MRRRQAPVSAELAGSAPRTALAHGEVRLSFSVLTRDTANAE
jgi:hypothetical protein